MHHTLMIQGTTSDAGKSTLVTALGRVLHRRGVRVAPFKPQNMAPNSAPTVDGGEIGRAQALQAQACGVLPHSDMNPVLLRPGSDTRAEVFLQGQRLASMEALQYHHYKSAAMAAVMDSYQRLRAKYDVVLVEGAGSPAEINLRDRDIANMGFAEAVDCPVVLIADIDRGGVFAHLVGTLALLSATEQARIRGFVINRFRGDLALLQSGLDWLMEYTGKPVYGVLPWLPNLALPAEDAVLLPQDTQTAEKLSVVVFLWPFISEHTDMDPLRLHPQVHLQYVHPHQSPPPADLYILPGSNRLCADLQCLREQGWDTAIQRHLRYGGRLLAIGEGFHMLGKEVNDPSGIHGEAGSLAGLGLLDFTTTLGPQRPLRQVFGQLMIPGTQPSGAPVTGYQRSSGTSRGAALQRPLLHGEHYSEGACSADLQIIGLPAHGLFQHPEALSALLSWAGCPDADHFDHDAQVEMELERLADVLEQHVDIDSMLQSHC